MTEAYAMFEFLSIKPDISLFPILAKASCTRKLHPLRALAPFCSLVLIWYCLDCRVCNLVLIYIKFMQLENNILLSVVRERAKFNGFERESCLQMPYSPRHPKPNMRGLFVHANWGSLRTVRLPQLKSRSLRLTRQLSTWPP